MEIRIEPMHGGAKFNHDLQNWVRLSIADAVVLFGRLEQEIIEIAWLLKKSDLKERIQVARNPAKDNFAEVLEVMEKAVGQELDGLRGAFETLAKDRNLMVHGAWWMVDEKRPWVVWHKFIEDNESVIGEWFEDSRFARFMTKAGLLFDMCRKFHDDLEKKLGVKTSALGGL